MNKELKINILRALKYGLISKSDIETIIKSEGIIRLDLSIEGKQDPVFTIVQKLPYLKDYFINIISLGIGKKP